MEEEGKLLRSDKDNGMSPYEVAVRMFQREHDRWRQWALFFFGIIAFIFILAEKNPEVMPFWLPCFVAALVSAFWVAVAQNIRASTHAWRQVLFKIEKDQHTQVFHCHDENWSSWNRLEDLRVTLRIWKPDTWLSVTRILALLGVVLCIIFFITGSFALISWLGYDHLVTLLLGAILFGAVVFALYRFVVRRGT